MFPLCLPNFAIAPCFEQLHLTVASATIIWPQNNFFFKSTIVPIVFLTFRKSEWQKDTVLTLKTVQDCYAWIGTVFIETFSFFSQVFCKVADPGPDPYWIRVRIPIGSGSGSLLDPDPDPGGQKWPKKVTKIKKFHVLKCWTFSFESWRLLL